MYGGTWVKPRSATFWTISKCRWMVVGVEPKTFETRPMRSPLVTLVSYAHQDRTHMQVPILSPIRRSDEYRVRPDMRNGAVSGGNRGVLILFAGRGPNILTLMTISYWTHRSRILSGFAEIVPPGIRVVLWIALASRWVARAIQTQL